MKIMKTVTIWVYTVLLALLLLAATERQAMAYADPGSGALIWQAAVAGLAGLLFYFRRIRAWFKNRRPKV